MKSFRNATDVKVFVLDKGRHWLKAHDIIENIHVVSEHVGIVEIRRHREPHLVRMTVFAYMPAGNDAISGMAVRTSGEAGSDTNGISVMAWRERSANMLTYPQSHKAASVHLITTERAFETPAPPELVSDRHPTVDLPAMFEGPRLPTSYNPTGAKIDDYSPGELRRIAAELSYVWGDFADEDIIEQAASITDGLRKLASRIENGE